MSFKELLNELSKSTLAKRKAQFNKQAKMDDDDPEAYKPAPGDATAKTKPSKHTKKFKQMFGETEEVDESRRTQRNYKLTQIGPYNVKATVCYISPVTRLRTCDDIWFRSKMDALGFKDNVKGFPKGAEVEAIKESIETIELDEGDATAALKKKAEQSGMPYNILKQVFDRGVAAWKTSHRPGTTPIQWGLARVNSFATMSSGTWGKADADLAAKVK